MADHSDFQMQPDAEIGLFGEPSRFAGSCIARQIERSRALAQPFAYQMNDRSTLAAATAMPKPRVILAANRGR
jgi:hypothetical protein